MPLEIVWKQLKREKCVFVDKNGVGTRIVWRVTRQMALTARAPRPSRPSAVVCRAVGICFFFCRQSCVGLCSRVSNRCPASEWNKAPADGRAKNALFSVCAESQFVCSWPPWPSGCFYKEISECCVSQCFVWRVDIFSGRTKSPFLVDFSLFLSQLCVLTQRSAIGQLPDSRVCLVLLRRQQQEFCKFFVVFSSQKEARRNRLDFLIGQTNLPDETIGKWMRVWWNGKNDGKTLILY